MTGHQELSAARERGEALAHQEQLLLRIGAICAVAGPLLLAASFAPHGDLPTDNASLVGEAAALRYVANHPTWLLIHAATIVAGLLWVGAFTALAGTLAPGAAGALGRLLVPSAIVGGVFVVFDYGVDGYALKILADAWAAASEPQQAQLLLMADTAVWFLNGTFRSEIVVFYGLTVLLAGLAVALDGRYPVWFGGIGAAAGATVFVNGILSFAGASLSPVAGEDFLVFVVILPLESLWLLALGILMWQRAGRVHAATRQSWAAMPR